MPFFKPLRETLPKLMQLMPSPTLSGKENCQGCSGVSGATMLWAGSCLHGDKNSKQRHEQSAQ